MHSPPPARADLELSKEERVDVLLHLKHTVADYGGAETAELVRLINRELDLLRRGRGAQAMVNLRKRISALYLDLMGDEQFNPEASKYNYATA